MSKYEPYIFKFLKLTSMTKKQYSILVAGRILKSQCKQVSKAEKLRLHSCGTDKTKLLKLLSFASLTYSLAISVLMLLSYLKLLVQSKIIK